MKTCVTIDFDIIFGNSFDFFCIGEAYPMGNMEKTNPLLSYIRPDYTIYKKITAYIAKIIAEKKVPVYFIDEHKHVLDFLDKNEQWNVINIDHHADLLSGDMEADDQDVLNNGNWGLYGFTEYNFNNYLHVSNVSPIEFPKPIKILQSHNVLGQHDVYMRSVIDYDFNEINEPDILVLCLSPQYVTEVSVPLYDLWKDIYEALRGNE